LFVAKLLTGLPVVRFLEGANMLMKKKAISISPKNINPRLKPGVVEWSPDSIGFRGPFL
jgi:hypothetical protein